MRGLAVCTVLLFLCACTVEGPSVKTYQTRMHVTHTTPEKFDQCHGYGCRLISSISLTDATWAELEDIFTPPSRSAEEERQRIAQAIGLMETRVGTINGTSEDIRDTFYKWGDTQLDCVDESTNTTTYLDLFAQKSWLTYHEVLTPHARMPIITGKRWWHQTAVIREKESGLRYAVDSWYEDNGKPAYVVSYDDWASGWSPVRE